MERLPLALFLVFFFCLSLLAGGRHVPDWDEVPVPLTTQDTIPLKDRGGPFVEDRDKNPFDLRDPKVIDQEIEYDPETGEYKVTEKIGEDHYRPGTNMSFTEFLNFKSRQQDQEYLKNLAGITT
ncbi:MAG TPA: hypothetical protein VFX48_09665, partial [Saprospiraceae bacterium]|nr:hypothetical protein [Saprospiraceae bacterium]